MTPEETRAFTAFWDHVRRTEEDVRQNWYRGHPTPDAIGDPWDDEFAKAYDAFGDRWALRVMPPVLMQLMRHESIDTTMRFYVGRSAQATADVVWEAYEKAVEQPKKEKPQERDTLRDTQPPPESGRDGLADAS